jgi:hypothetical protein
MYRFLHLPEDSDHQELFDAELESLQKLLYAKAEQLSVVLYDSQLLLLGEHDRLEAVAPLLWALPS